MARACPEGVGGSLERLSTAGVQVKNSTNTCILRTKLFVSSPAAAAALADVIVAVVASSSSAAVDIVVASPAAPAAAVNVVLLLLLVRLCILGTVK